MAAYTINNAAAPYYWITVDFGDRSFEQQIVSVKTGKALSEQIQAYTDAYEVEWFAANPIISR